MKYIIISYLRLDYYKDEQKNNIKQQITIDFNKISFTTIDSTYLIGIHYLLIQYLLFNIAYLF